MERANRFIETFCWLNPSRLGALILSEEKWHSLCFQVIQRTFVTDAQDRTLLATLNVLHVTHFTEKVRKSVGRRSLTKEGKNTLQRLEVLQFPSRSKASTVYSLPPQLSASAHKIQN